MYQRFAYRIVMQGYWLEGGSTVFYFQAFYRWIVGLLHVVFGDSSVGEWYLGRSVSAGGRDAQLPDHADVRRFPLGADRGGVARSRCSCSAPRTT